MPVPRRIGSVFSGYMMIAPLHCPECYYYRMALYRTICTSDALRVYKNVY